MKRSPITPFYCRAEGVSWASGSDGSAVGMLNPSFYGNYLTVMRSGLHPGQLNKNLLGWELGIKSLKKSFGVVEKQSCFKPTILQQNSGLHLALGIYTAPMLFILSSPSRDNPHPHHQFYYYMVVIPGLTTCQTLL